MATEEWKLLCVIRDCHAYTDMWDPVLKHQFRTKHQKHNSHDRCAVAVVPVDMSASSAGHFAWSPHWCFVVFLVSDGALQNEQATYSSLLTWSK